MQFLKRNFKDLVLLILGGMLAPYLGSLTGYIEANIFNLSEAASNKYYIMLGRFDPFYSIINFIVFFSFLFIFCIMYYQSRAILLSINGVTGIGRLFYFMTGLPIALIVITLLTISMIYSDGAKKLGRFNSEMIELTPYIEAKEIALLKSKWVSMKNKSQFDYIDAKISGMYKQAKLERPD